MDRRTNKRQSELIKPTNNKKTVTVSADLDCSWICEINIVRLIAVSSEHLSQTIEHVFLQRRHDQVRSQLGQAT